MNNLLTYYSVFYVLVILCFTVIFQSFSGWMFIVYAVLAAPFIKNTTILLCVCLVVSTTAYYYLGCDEQIYSIYSILFLLSLISHKKEIIQPSTLKRIIPFVLFMGVASISFVHSSLNHYNGLYELLYIILIAIIIITCIDIDYSLLYKVLPILSCLMIFFIILKMSIGAMGVNGRFTIDSSVDANTSGAACALFATIFTITLLVKKCNNYIIYLIGCFLAIAALFLTGSRSALMGYIGSNMIVYCLISYRQHRMARKFFRLILSGVFLIVICFPILESYIDFSRFLDISGIVQSGGTHRTQIYELIIQYTLDHDFFWGYGPGHVCSSDIVSMLMHRNLAHTHNNFIESFGEMGICGLIVFLIIVFISLKSVLMSSKTNPYMYLPLGLLSCIIINGFGESFLCDIVFWIITAICIGSIHGKKGYLTDNGKFYKSYCKYICPIF